MYDYFISNNLSWDSQIRSEKKSSVLSNFFSEKYQCPEQ